MYFLDKIYQKVIISIELNPKTCKVLIDYHNNSKKEEKTYETVNGDLPIDAIKHIRRIKNKYPFTYLASMIRESNQGLLHGNDLGIFDKFNINTKTVSIMLVNKSWFLYIGKTSLQKEKNKFNKVYGIDFLFSPFVIIYERVKKQLEDIKKLYILQGRYACTLLIANKRTIFFGKYIAIEDGFFEEKESIEYNQINKNNVIEFDALNDIDENIIIKSFDEDEKEDIDLDSTVSGLNDVTIAGNIINVIKDALNEFYNDTRYEGDFIEELLILDSYGISDNIISHLKSHIMLDVRLLQIDFCEEILKLSKMELRL